MKISKRVPGLEHEKLKYARQLGVRHIIGYMPEESAWDFQDLLEARKRVESWGLELAALGSPPKETMKSVMTAGQDRDEQIDRFRMCLRNMGRVGIPVLGYNFSLLGNWGRWREGLQGGGRGDAGLMSFDYDLVKNAPPSELGPVSDEEMWSRLEYFLRAVVPVAEEEGVGLACHPDDPPVPQMRGIARILRTVDGLKRLIETAPSPANGLTFCQGTVAEMGADVLEAIRTFGERKKIFIVHFRNVSVHSHDPLNYDEVFIDEGDVDMLEAIKAYREVGYEGLLDPDHAPVMAGDSQWGREKGLAFALGYIRALEKTADRAQG